MSIKINPFVVTAILIGIGILIIALVRGCSNEKKLAASTIDYKGRIDAMAKDSIETSQQLSAYKDTMEFMDGQLSLSKNKELSLNEDLGKANDRITILLRKHVPIKPSSDTSMTWAPNEFINECSECFHELQNGQQLVKKYKAEKDNQEQICNGKLNVKDNRIGFLEKSNTKLTKDYKSLIDSAGKVERKGMLYFSYGVLWDAYVPKMGGIGLMYQDKRLRQFGVKGYFGSSKPLIETQVNMPLSFKRK